MCDTTSWTSRATRQPFFGADTALPLRGLSACLQRQAGPIAATGAEGIAYQPCRYSDKRLDQILFLIGIQLQGDGGGDRYRYDGRRARGHRNPPGVVVGDGEDGDAERWPSVADQWGETDPGERGRAEDRGDGGEHRQWPAPGRDQRSGSERPEQQNMGG